MGDMILVDNGNIYRFGDWFSITLPNKWEFEFEEEILNIYSIVNPKGVLQISFYRNHNNDALEDIAKNKLDNFIQQFLIEINNNTYKIIETPSFVIANVSGKNNNDYIKVWIIVNEDKLLLITYNSATKTRELSKVDDIVYSIDFTCSYDIE